MSPAAEMLPALIGIAAVMAALTLFAELLRSVIWKDRHLPLTEGLIARINTWWAMFVLITLSLVFGRAGLMLLFAGVSFAALREFLTLTIKTRADHWALLAAFFVVLPAQYLMIGFGLDGLWPLFIPVWVGLFLPALSVMRGAPARFLTRAGETQWALMVAIYALSHIPALALMELPGQEDRGVLLIAFLVLVVQLADAARYGWSKLLPSHPIAPVLSSSKTWEGFAAGIASALMIGAGLFWLTPFGPVLAGAVAGAVTLMGFIGGLVMSAIKRDKGVRDWGHLVAGHGGFIDRFDSVIFAAPVFYHLLRALAGGG